MPRKRRYKRKPFKPVNYDAFREILRLCRLSKPEVADLLRVSLRTVQYWEKGQASIPYAAFKLLRILTGYALPGNEWHGWMFHGGRLISPDGKTFTPVDLAMLHWTFEKARMWEQDYHQRQARLPAVVPLRLVKGDTP